MKLSAVSLFVLCAAAACGDQPRPGTGSDAGPGIDAPPGIDAAPGSDAAPGIDAPVALDAGPGIDAPDAPPRVLTNTPDRTYVTDGDVNAIARVGETIYLGGSFARVGPRTGPGVQVSLDGAWSSALPEISGAGPSTSGGAATGLRAVVGDGAGGWYVSGLFTHVGGLARSNIAHILNRRLGATTRFQAGWLAARAARARRLTPGYGAGTGATTCVQWGWLGISGARDGCLAT